ncbi:diguanylate cyclase [Actinosynnema sp. NPDC050801]|uniref:diguanylate cyclase domain-containing protein n=1 Tax=unclassified Actinosynnema TaxID=2637065 RepID=UPI0033E80A19
MTDAAITPEHIAAARLRLVLDAKLGRPTPDRIRRIAGMTRPDEPPSRTPPAVSHDRGPVRDHAREWFRLQVEAAREGAEDRTTWLLLVDVGAIGARYSSISQAAVGAAQNEIFGLLWRASGDEPPVARLGEDEFAVLVTAPGHGPDSGIAVAERMRAAVAGHDWRELLGTDRQPEVNVGVTAVRPGETLQEALARVDGAVREARRRGGDRVALAEADVEPFARGERRP